jgi:hypothetical protein
VFTKPEVELSVLVVRVLFGVALNQHLNDKTAPRAARGLSASRRGATPQ